MSTPAGLGGAAHAVGLHSCFRGTGRLPGGCSRKPPRRQDRVLPLLARRRGRCPASAGWVTTSAPPSSHSRSLYNCPNCRGSGNHLALILARTCEQRLPLGKSHLWEAGLPAAPAGHWPLTELQGSGGCHAFTPSAPQRGCSLQKIQGGSPQPCTYSSCSLSHDEVNSTARNTGAATTSARRGPAKAAE